MLEEVAAWCLKQGFAYEVFSKMADFLQENGYRLQTMPDLWEVHKRSGASLKRLEESGRV